MCNFVPSKLRVHSAVQDDCDQLSKEADDFINKFI